MIYERIFSARIVNTWNSLPNHVVDVNSLTLSLNLLKARLNEFWSNQHVKYDFTAVLTGIYGARREGTCRKKCLSCARGSMSW